MVAKIFILIFLFEHMIKAHRRTRGHNMMLIKEYGRLDVRKYSLSRRTTIKNGINYLLIMCMLHC